MYKRRYQQILNHLWTTAELKIGAIFGVLWAIFDMAIGGIDTPIKALAILIILDFITGVTAGYKTGCLSSKVGSKGIIKKVGIFVCIMFAYLLDTAMAINMFRGMVISGFARRATACGVIPVRNADGNSIRLGTVPMPCPICR